MCQKKILTPTKDAESWRAFLAEPLKQWKDGFSAKAVAESWESEGELPKSIKTGLNKEDILSDADLIIGIPEYTVKMPGKGKGSQNDVLAVMSNSKNLIIATIEAKVKEDFDKTLSDWLHSASDNRKHRISEICKIIGFPNRDYHHLRFQLFHRLASAVLMAKKFHASHAIMIIQSFESDDSQNHYFDFEHFIEAYGKKPEKGKPIVLAKRDSITIWTMWINS